MARKFVSGVLAFAMVFGATAPVVFAEPVATEVVDQEANYLPSFAESSVTLKDGDIAIVKVNDISDTATLKFSKITYTEASGAAATQNTESDTVEWKYIPSSKSVMINLKTGKKASDIAKDFKYYFTIEDTDTKNNYSSKTLTLAVKGPAAAAAYTGTLTTASKIEVTSGKSNDYTIAVDDKAPKSLTWQLTVAAQEYVAVSSSPITKDGVVTGTKITFTGLKAVPKTEDRTLEVTIKVDGKTYKLPIEVTNATSSAAMTLKANTNKMTTAESATLVAQAYKTDAYGNLIVDDAAALVWSINGVETNKYTDGKGNTLAELTNTGAIRSFTATTAGTYVVTVSDVAGTHSATREITVTSADKPTGLYIAKSTTDLDAADASMTVKPGTTIDMSALNYAVNVGKNKALLSAFSGYTASYELVDATNNKKYLSSYNIATGKYTLVGADDADMAAAIADGKVLELKVNVTFTKSGSATLTLAAPYTIKVTKAGSKGATLKVTDAAGFEAVATTEGSSPVLVKNANKIMSVGATNEFKVAVTDKNGFSDVSQDMIWSVENTTKEDKTVYAVNNGSSVTALVESAGKAELVGVSMANPDLQVRIKLYITAAKPTATPTATATPAPTATAAPTAEPTKAPETKTGKVTASSLRVRETPVDGTVVGKLAKGTEVTITEEKDGWYKVTAGSLTGWVSGEYVELTTPSTNETATTTANLRLRKTAPSGSVLATMPKGAKVEVVEKGSEWSKVKYNGKTGFASNAYLEFEEDAVG